MSPALLLYASFIVLNNPKLKYIDRVGILASVNTITVF